MALLLTKLKDELDKLFDENNPAFAGWPANIAVGANNLASAYATYALDAKDLSGDNVLVFNQAGFAAQIATLTVPGTYLTASQVFEAAFVSFWTGAIFGLGIPPVPTLPCPNIGGTMLFSLEITSIVTAVIPGILQPLLFTEFQKVDNADMAGKTLRMAQALHTATTSAVVVTITGLDTTPPPGGPLPIVNVCTIF